MGYVKIGRLLNAMIETVLVYCTLTCLMLILNRISLCMHAEVSAHHDYKSNVPIAVVFVFALVFGIRYNVGVDHLRYIEKYEQIKYSSSFVDTELLYFWINKVFAFLNLHYSFLFFFLAFIQLYLLLYSIRSHRNVMGWLIFTFMISASFLSFMNVIRQEVAFCLQLVAFSYLSRKKIFYCYLFIIIAILFHISAIILLPFPLLYLRKNSYFSNSNIQLLLFIVFLFIGVFFRPSLFIFSLLSDYIDVFEYFGYDSYVNMVDRGDLKFMESARGLGFGFILISVLNAISVYYSSRVKNYYNSALLNIFYDFYYIGMLFYYLTLGSLIFTRINYYFYDIGFIYVAFLLNYLYRNKSVNNFIVLFLIVIIYFLLFYASVVISGYENCAVYNTFF